MSEAQFQALRGAVEALGDISKHDKENIIRLTAEMANLRFAFRLLMEEPGMAKSRLWVLERMQEMHSALPSAGDGDELGKAFEVTRAELLADLQQGVYSS